MDQETLKAHWKVREYGYRIAEEVRTAALRNLPQPVVSPARNPPREVEVEELPLEEARKLWKARLTGYQVAEDTRVEALRNRDREGWLRSLHSLFFVREPHTTLFVNALRVQRAIRSAGLRFCFVGGVPLQHWGEVRVTTDVDLTVLCELGDELRVGRLLWELFLPRVDDPEDLAVRRRMFLGRLPDGTPVDVSLAGIPYERRMIDRARDVDFGIEAPLFCCGPEDLVITKTVAGRLQDWVDIKRIIQRSGRSMDWDIVWDELPALLNLVEEPERLGQLRELVEQER